MVASRSGCSSTIRREQGAVGDVALVEDPVADEGQRPGEQRVEDDRRVPGLLERLGGGRADVAGAAGDENLHAARVPAGRVTATAARRTGTIASMPTALITGITGQDGLYLAELLLAKGYDVHGVIRGQNNPKRDLVERLLPDVRLHNGDLTDMSQPDPGPARLRPRRGLQPRRRLVRRLLLGERGPHHRRDRQGRAHHARGGPAARRRRPRRIRFYQASSSEMFGKVQEVAAARAHPAVAALAVRREQGLRAPHDHQLPRVLRHARLVGDPVQPRVAAPRRRSS